MMTVEDLDWDIESGDEMRCRIMEEFHPLFVRDRVESRLSIYQVIYLSIYEGRLFVCHVEISQIRFSFAGLLVPLESSQ